MLRSLWSGVSGLRTNQTRMDVIGNDIANVNTVGFKKSNVTFKEQLVNTIRAPSTGTLGQQVGMGVQLGSIARNFSDGILTETQRSSNMAITGDGLFTVADPVTGGAKYFTRAGDFLPDVNTATGETYLINSDGKRLQGIMDANPDSTGLTSDSLVDIVLPANTTQYSIGSDGKIWASISGATPAVVGMVPLARFANNNGLSSVGSNMYSGTVAAAEQPMVNPGSAGAGTIYQGYLENANVDLAQEFTDMIVTERGYQANSRSITTSDEMLQELLSLKR
jgi:flagellar hook protein FlgE